MKAPTRPIFKPQTVTSPKRSSYTYISSTFSAFTTLLLGVITGIIAARILGPRGRGELTIFFFLPNLLGSISNLALPQASAYILSKPKSNKPRVIAAATTLGLIIGVIGSLFFFATASFFLGSESSEVVQKARWLCLFSTTMAIIPTLWSIHLAVGHIIWANLSRVLNAFLYLLFLVFYYFNSIPSAFTIALVSLLISSTVSITHWLFLGKAGRLIPRKNDLVKISSKAMNFLAPGILFLLFDYADRGILIRTVNLEDLGLYAVAFSLASPLLAIIEPISQIGFIDIAAGKDIQSSKKLLIERFHLIQTALFLFGITIAIISPWAIRFLFGRDFKSAALPALVMIAAMVIHGSTRALNGFLRACGQATQCAISYSIALITLTALGFYLSTTHGLTGFTIAFFSATFLNLIGHLIIAKTCLKIDFLHFWTFTPSRLNVVWRTFRGANPSSDNTL